MKAVKISAAAAMLVLAGLGLNAFLPETFPYPELKVFGQAYMLVLTKFVDPVKDDRLLLGAQRGLLGSLDPFSTFVPAGKMEAFRKSRASGPLDAGLELRRAGRFAYAHRVFPGSPAAEFLKPGDIVEAVNGVQYPQADVWELQAQLSGPLGSSVKVVFSSRDAEKSNEAVLKLKPWERPTVRLDLEEGAPILRLPVLGPATASEARDALGPHKGRGLLFIDLRGNTSFDYDAALKAAALFQEEAPRIVLKSRREEKKSNARAEGAFRFSDLHVLTDRDTTGAAEILALLLQKGAGAKVIGRPTFGYTGLLQMVPLSDGGACHLTYTLVTLPDGTDLTGKGVQPDVAVRDPLGAETASDAIDKKVREIVQEKALPKAA